MQSTHIAPYTIGCRGNSYELLGMPTGAFLPFRVTLEAIDELIPG